MRFAAKELYFESEATPTRTGIYAALALLVVATSADSRAGEVFQITNNDDVWDSSPVVSGSNVVWYAKVGDNRAPASS